VKTSLANVVVSATHVMPARCAASMPTGASSKATQRPGATPRRFAASRKTSGCGLPCATSSARATAANARSIPSSHSDWSTFSRGAEVATGPAPRRASAARKPESPGNGASPASSSR
jgi:hypothetical protein